MQVKPLVLVEQFRREHKKTPDPFFSFLLPSAPFPCQQLLGPTFSRDFSLGHTGLLQFPSSPCYRVAATTPPVRNIPSASLGYSMLSSPHIEWLDHRSLGIYEACSAFTRVATRQLARQPCADFIGRLQHVDYSSCCYPS